MDYLRELTDAQLRAVLGALESKIKEARTKAYKALSRRPDLSKAWVHNLSGVAANTTAELAEKVREDRRRTFEKALVESPEAYVLYQTSIYLQSLYTAVRNERMDRAKVKKE
jgi:hypothetical protein